MIQVNGLKYGFEQQVLDIDELEILEGELTCLLGPNGCGKTTLLNCLTSYYSDYEGTITLGDNNLRSISIKDRAKQISYVPQMTKESFPYTVYDIILMGRTPFTHSFMSPGKKDQVIVDEIIEYLNIEHLKHRPFTQLSGGEAQLVKIGRGLAQQAKIHVMDEPTAALDLGNELQLLNTIMDLVEHKNNAVVMATHYPNQPLFLENNGINVKACLMKNGEIIYEGKPSKVINEQTLKHIYGVSTMIIDYQNSDLSNGRYVIPNKTRKIEVSHE